MELRVEVGQREAELQQRRRRATQQLIERAVLRAFQEPHAPVSRRGSNL
jgi:hypothetical protein